MKKRNLLRLALLAGVGLAGFVFLWWWSTPNHRINRASFDQIQIGMAEQEAVAILGTPPTRDGVESVKRIKKKHDVVAVMGGVGHSGFKAWVTDGTAIAIDLDNNGNVASKIYFRFEETLFDKFRRLLHL